MTYASPPPATTTTPLRWALIGSLAVNLAVAGLALGVYLHNGSGARGELVRDLGFGPYDDTLRPADRDVLKQAIRAKSGDIKAMRAELSADAAAMVTALRTEPFDVSALDAAFSGQEAHLSARIKLGNQTLRDFLTQLPQKDRLDFADRLEHQMQRGRGAEPLAK